MSSWQSQYPVSSGYPQGRGRDSRGGGRYHNSQNGNYNGRGGGGRGGGRGRGRGWGGAEQPDPAVLRDEQQKALHQLEGWRFRVDNRSCTVPEPQQLFSGGLWSLPQLMAAKSSLNDTKDKLDHMDIRPWGRHTTFTNRAADVVNNLRRLQAPPEMVTIAWAKMFECLGTYDLLPQELPDLAAAATAAALDGHNTSPSSPVAPACEDDDADDDSPSRQPQVPGSHSSTSASSSGTAKVLTVHVCEAPGAFIAATNHYIKTQRPSWAHRWTWMGNSLNPYHEGNDPNAMIDDDALIAATPDSWCFGADGSGDIRQPNNIAHIWRAAKAAAAGAAPVDVQPSPTSAPAAAAVALMVTGDGSIDCQENPNEQEAVTAALHFCEFVCALGLLAPGGRVLLKMFTLYEHSSLCMMYLAGALFEEVHVVKPCSSKPGNSETYLVAVGYKGCPEPLLAALLQHCSPNSFDSAALLPLELLPQQFLSSASNCAIFFGRRQQETIEENLSLYDHFPGTVKEVLIQAKRWLADKWPQQFRLMPLDRPYFLAPVAVLAGNKNNTALQVDASRKRTAGTLAERREEYARRRAINGTGAALPVDSQGQPAPAQPQREAAVKMGAAASIMQKMGWEAGKGLGKESKGIAEPLAVAENARRAGLGFAAAGEGSAAVQPAADPYLPKPDAVPFLNPSVQQSTQHAAGSSRVEVYCSAGALFTPHQALGMLHPKLLLLPGVMMRSKFLPDDQLLLQLREARQQAAAAAAAVSSAKAGSGVLLNHKHEACLHLGGQCVAPLASSSSGSALWHLRALDMLLQLTPLLFSSSSSGSSCSGSAATTICLDLSTQDCSVARYIHERWLQQQQQQQEQQQQNGALSDGRPTVLHLVVSSCEAGVQMVADHGEQPKTETASKKGAAASRYKASLWDVNERSSMGGKPLALAAEAAGGVQLVIGQLAPSAALSEEAQTADGIMEAEFSSSCQLHLLWEAAAGLSCLAEGGSMVLRLADSMTSFSAGLLHLLTSCFGSLTLLKPFTSCSANAERFVVCKGLLPGGGCKAAAEQLMQAVSLLQEHLQQQQAGTAAAEIGKDPADNLLLPASPAAEASQAAAAGSQAHSLPVLELVSPAAVVSAPIFKYVAARNMQLARLEVAALQAATEQLKKTAAKAAERRISCRKESAQLSGLVDHMQLTGMPAVMLQQLDDSSIESYKKLQAAAEERLAAWETQASSQSLKQQSTVQHATSASALTNGHMPASNYGNGQAGLAASSRPGLGLMQTKASTTWVSGDSTQTQVSSGHASPSYQAVLPAAAAAAQPQPVVDNSWAGDLRVVSGKGVEFVCRLKCGNWPQGVPRLKGLLIQGYEPLHAAFVAGSISSVQLEAASPADAKKLAGLVRWMAGWRGEQRSSGQKAGWISRQGLLPRQRLCLVVGGANEDAMVCHVLH